MNLKLLTAIALLILVGGTAVLYKNNKGTVETPPLTETNTIPPENPSLTTETKLCYLSQFQGALPVGTEPDIDYLELHLDPASKNVTGIYNWIPSGKDSSRGQLYGTYEQDPIANSINPSESLLFKGKYLFIIEGSEEGRELYIKFDANSARLGAGELIGNGTAVMQYKDPNTITYPKTFPRVDCTTVKPEYTTVPRGTGGES